jgi:hypothetical protein
MFDFSNRYFRLWMYSCSHNRLLLRSDASGVLRTLDLRFVGVTALNLKTNLDGLVVSGNFETRTLESPGITSVRAPGSDLFLLQSKTTVHSISASRMDICESDLDYTDIGDWG